MIGLVKGMAFLENQGRVMGELRPEKVGLVNGEWKLLMLMPDNNEYFENYYEQI